jgi:hypothetical protein
MNEPMVRRLRHGSVASPRFEFLELLLKLGGLEPAVRQR